MVPPTKEAFNFELRFMKDRKFLDQDNIANLSSGSNLMSRRNSKQELISPNKNSDHILEQLKKSSSSLASLQDKEGSFLQKKGNVQPGQFAT